MVKCDKCEMCNKTTIKKECKKPEPLIPFATKEDPVIHVESDWIKGTTYYVWTNGYKCLYNGKEGINKADLSKGRCRLRGE